MRAFSASANPIVVPSASCAAMLYHSSKIAFRGSDEAERAAVDAFARRVWEFCDYLANVLGVEKSRAGSTRKSPSTIPATARAAARPPRSGSCSAP